MHDVLHDCNTFIYNVFEYNYLFEYYKLFKVNFGMILFIENKSNIYKILHILVYKYVCGPWKDATFFLADYFNYLFNFLRYEQIIFLTLICKIGLLDICH